MGALEFYFPLIIIIIIITFFYFRARKLLNRNENLPPSPSSPLPIIGHLHLFKGPLHQALAALSARHGPILFLRFGSRPVVLVSSPDLAEECFTKNDIVFANRPTLLVGKHFGYNYTTIAWASYGSHWRNLRRIASTEVLSTNRLQLLHHIRVDEVRLMIRQLFQASYIGELKFSNQDMKSVLFELTMNAVVRMIMGESFYGESGMEAEEAREFKELVKEGFRLGSATNADFIPTLKWIGVGGAVEKRMVEVQKNMNNIMKNLIKDHKKMTKDAPPSPSSVGRSRTLVDFLMSLKETEPEFYKDEIINGIMQDILTAGTETSAGTIEWALSLLLNNPDSLSKAQAEIDDHVGPNRLTNESDLANLPYLHGVILETLRMYPPSPLIPPHVSSDCCTVGGFSIPQGTMLVVNLRAIQNDPKLWDEPERFMPERFVTDTGRLQGDPTKYGFKWFPFGAERRRCPGEGLAMRMVGLVLGSLLQCFEWKRVGEEMVDMGEGSGFTMPKAKPLVAQYRARSTMLHLLSQL